LPRAREEREKRKGEKIGKKEEADIWGLRGSHADSTAT
jgi:hypothetical protein